MLFVLLLVFIILATLVYTSKNFDEISADIFFVLIVLIFIDLVSLCKTLVDYNRIKSTADKKIELLEKENERYLSQIEIVADKYLVNENTTFKDLKQSVEVLQTYPELKSNDFLQAQISAFQKNEEELKKLYLEKISLRTYKFYIFVGE